MIAPMSKPAKNSWHLFPLTTKNAQAALRPSTRTSNQVSEHEVMNVSWQTPYQTIAKDKSVEKITKPPRKPSIQNSTSFHRYPKTPSTKPGTKKKNMAKTKRVSQLYVMAYSIVTHMTPMKKE